MKYFSRIFIFYFALSLVLVILPLDGFVSSVKSVLGYIFIPQIRASHGAAMYAEGVYDTVKDLLNTGHENELLRREIAEARLSAQQTEDILAENERLSALLRLAPQKKWKGVYASMVYREPNRWNTIIVDKGSMAGVELQSAAVGVGESGIGLIGTVIEVAEFTSKILLVNDPEFSAAAYLEGSQTEGMATGGGDVLRLQFLPLEFSDESGTRLFTSPRSVVFPSGILIGTVKGGAAQSGDAISKTLIITPEVAPYSVKEVFIIKR